MSQDNTTISNKNSDRRERLREFQTQLLERMKIAQSNTSESENQLGVVIGDTHFLINLHEAGEIVSAGGITPVPLTKGWYKGLINIRGNLIGVIDLLQFQDLQGIDIKSNSPVVAFASHLAFNAGLIVTKVVGLRNVALMNEKPLLQSLPWRPKCYVDDDKQEWMTLNIEQLIVQSEFLHIER